MHPLPFILRSSQLKGHVTENLPFGYQILTASSLETWLWKIVSYTLVDGSS